MNLISLLITVEQGTLFITLIFITVLLAVIVLILLMLYNNQKAKSNNRKWRYQEELFNALGYNLDDVFIIFDVIHSKYEYVSPNFEKSLGVSKESLIQNYFDLLEYVPEDSRNKLFDMIFNPTMSKMTEVEFEFHHPGTQRMHWIMIRVYPTFREGQLFRYVASISDITKEKNAQKSLEEALDKLKDSNEAKKEFLSHVSHELKTPIHAIIGMSQIASNSINDRQKVENCLKRIDYASSKLLEMINNILDISKIDNNKITIDHEPFNLMELLQNVSHTVSDQADMNHQKYSSNYNQIHDYYLIGDEMRLLQVLNNCLSNALKFTPSGGTISFDVNEIERTEEQIVLRFYIKDTGKGMSASYLEHLFVPFEQEDRSIVQKYGGTGLGMSITKSLVSLMGGDILVDSQIDAGTCIQIDLPFPIDHNPLIPKETPHPIVNDLYNEAEQQLIRNNSGNRVLIVEDNEINQEIVMEFLKRINFEVETASDGFEAIRLFEASQPGYYNIILMDLIMPGMDGYETTKKIRSSFHPDAQKICIIAVTADNFAEELKSMECGMNYHITKPFDITEFYSIIQNATQEE